MGRTINEELRKQRRAEICAAAEKLFADNGFAATTITNIAKEAKISHASVFTYFKSKEELINAVILEPLKASLLAYQAIINTQKPALVILRNLIQHQIRYGVDRRTYLRMVQQVLGQPEQYPELTEALMEYGESFVQMLEPIIKDGQRTGELEEGDPTVIGWTYFAFVNGAGLIFLGPYDGLPKQTEEYALRIFGVKS